MIAAIGAGLALALFLPTGTLLVVFAVTLVGSTRALLVKAGRLPEIRRPRGAPTSPEAAARRLVRRLRLRRWRLRAEPWQAPRQSLIRVADSSRYRVAGAVERGECVRKCAQRSGGFGLNVRAGGGRHSPYHFV